LIDFGISTGRFQKLFWEVSESVLEGFRKFNIYLIFYLLKEILKNIENKYIGHTP
jgi:hypothetical protein